MGFTTGRKTKFMKASIRKPAPTPQTPVFPQTLHRTRTDPAAIAKAATPRPKPQKRNNIFSKSRDTREDRGARQMKTSHNAQTFPHGR
jgi:hypothetical protein